MLVCWPGSALAKHFRCATMAQLVRLWKVFRTAPLQVWEDSRQRGVFPATGSATYCPDLGALTTRSGAATYARLANSAEMRRGQAGLGYDLGFPSRLQTIYCPSFDILYLSREYRGCLPKSMAPCSQYGDASKQYRGVTCKRVKLAARALPSLFVEVSSQHGLTLARAD
jgi:hypothetical protein